MEEKDIVRKILNSSYLKSIYFYALENPYFMQKDLNKSVPIKYPAHVSKSLKDLREMGVLKIENPEDPNFKRYQITDKGKKLKEKIEIYGK